MVASWIVNAITSELAGDAIYAETARDLWLDLEEHFSQVNGLHIFELQQKINLISQAIESAVLAAIGNNSADALYFLTIVDDYSKCTWLFLMKHKSETRFLLQSFYIYVETQFNRKIKVLRSNNGLEFNMKEFYNYKATNTNASKMKFDVRASRCVFLDYPYAQKGYKLYDLKTNRIFVSRDVQFHENTFPFIQEREMSSNKLVLPCPIIEQVPEQEDHSLESPLQPEEVYETNDGNNQNSDVSYWNHLIHKHDGPLASLIHLLTSKIIIVSWLYVIYQP
ncbi:hypothetical protein ACOSP7_005334 [Xanthoceras sorbifolium]